MRDLTQQLCRFARVAGHKIMPFYRAAAAVKTKEDRTPLTEADMASHQYLTEALKNLLPATPVISEESQPESHIAAAAQFWLVDPLDGTKEFLKGTNEFTVNIALIKDGYPVTGVVHAPALGVTYYASTSEGAWRQRDDQTPVPVRALSANPAKLSIVASKDHAGLLVARLLEHYSGASLRSMGSSLKFCLVADGFADLYLRDLPTMEWDTAAAQCVVECAGGSVHDLNGERLRYGKPGLKNPAVLTVGDASLAKPALKVCAAS